MNRELYLLKKPGAAQLPTPPSGNKRGPLTLIKTLAKKVAEPQVMPLGNPQFVK